MPCLSATGTKPRKSRNSSPSCPGAAMNRALGIDHGEARIGLAISDELGMLAHPLETIHLKEVAEPVAHIAAIVAREKIGMIVLGLPRNMDGSYGPAAEKVRAFA